MRAMVLGVALTALLATRTAHAQEVDDSPSAWVGGAGLTVVGDRHGVGIGGRIVARFHFVQAGWLGFAGTGDSGGFGTLGVVATLGKVDLGLEALLGSHTVETSQTPSFFGNCSTDGPEVSAPAAGAMFSVSRALRRGGAWVGGGVWFAQPLRTTRYTTRTTCTSWSLWGEDPGPSTTSSEDTLGRTVGLLFRIGFALQ